MRWLVCLILLAGCASQPRQSVSSIQATLQNRQVVAETSFDGVTEQQIFDAAIKVFDHLDGEDFEYDIRDNQLLAARQWSQYIVVGATWAKDFWELKTRTEGGRVYLTVAAITVSKTDVLATPISEKFRSDIQLSGRHDIGLTVADYRLFYDRINYFLRIKQDWPECKRYQAKEQLKLFMCSKHVKDRRPTT